MKNENKKMLDELRISNKLISTMMGMALLYPLEEKTLKGLSRLLNEEMIIRLRKLDISFPIGF